jgi:amino acid adenylation domain-containing protein
LRLLREFNDTKADYPKDKNVIQLFEEQASKTPDAVAVVFRDDRISYRELSERSSDLASRLRAEAVSEITAIYVYPSVEMVIGILGILKSGSAFLPLDPHHNPRRTEAILQDSGCTVLLTQPGLAHDLSFAGTTVVLDMKEQKINREFALTGGASELLYVIYTSGSTGKPKGVKIAHRNLVNYHTWFVHKSRLSANDRLLLSTSYAFDAIYTQFFSSLLTGAELHVVPRETYLSPAGLIEYIDRHRISFLKFTPTLFGSIISAPEFKNASFKSVRLLMLGGEAIHPADLSRIAATHPHIELMNHFGPTETTIGSVACSIDKKELPGFIQRPVIGKPISNTRCYILGTDGELLPPGAKGELCISGDGVGLGYLNQEKLTSEKFIPNPFEQGERLYKTGDLARWTPEGNIEYLGRIDQQVKIRGYRVEPGEIEAHLSSYEQINRCIVALREKEGRSFLVAYYTGTEASPPALRAFLAERLPDYMVPSFYMHLGEMPLTPNGKIDRKALPEPEMSRDESYAAPSNKTEETLAQLWSEILRIPAEKVGVEQSFFELGGDSLTANTLILKIREIFQVTVSWPDLFAHPTIRYLQQLIGLSEKASEDAILAKSPAGNFYPATRSQKSFFIGAKFNPSEVFFDIMALYEVSGSIDPERLADAISRVIRRHESLRTSFTIEKGKVMQLVSEEFSFELQVVETEIDDINEVIRSLKKPFNYSGFLLRTYHIKSTDRQYLFLDMPHIIGDGHSLRIIMSEIAAHYANKEVDPSPPQFSHFVAWQEGFFTTEDFRKKEEYWLNQFAVLPDGLRFRQPASKGKDITAGSLLLKLPGAIQALMGTGAAGGTTFNLLLSAYFILLSRMSGQEEIAVGVPTRFMNRLEFNGIAGLLTNTLALKCRLLPHMTLSSCVKAVHEVVIQGLQNKEYPLDLLMEKLKSGNKTPILFNTYLNYEKVESVYRLDGATLTRQPLKIWREKLPLSVDIYDDGGQISFRIKYQLGAITEETVQKFFENYCRVVQRILENGDTTISELELEPCGLFEYGEPVKSYNN